MTGNASKHKAMSYDRMKTEDARLKAEIEALLQRAEQVDAEEDALYGVGKQPEDLPAELQRREGRRAKIREALGALKRETAKARAAELAALADGLHEQAADPTTSPKFQADFTTRAAQHDQQSADLDDDDPPPPAVDGDLPRNTPPKKPSGEPKPKAQRNFTDPDSRIMFKDGTYVQAYNAQIAVDDADQIIVAAALSNQGTDVEYFEPVLRRVVDNCDAAPQSVTADAGFFSAENMRAAEHLGCEPSIAVAHAPSGACGGEDAGSPPCPRPPRRAAPAARARRDRGPRSGPVSPPPQVAVWSADRRSSRCAGAPSESAAAPSAS